MEYSLSKEGENMSTVIKDRELFDLDCSLAESRIKEDGFLNNTAIIHFGSDETIIIDMESLEGNYPEKRHVDLTRFCGHFMTYPRGVHNAWNTTTVST
ncbi:MAG: hypothetical protein ACOC0U_04165 [Desulfovibrionales bacterium]